MSADIANWLLVNIVNNPQVFRSLIALIILIVAIFLFSKKPMEKGPFRCGLGASLFVFAIFVFLHANIADLAGVFIAWATIVLAGIAALSFEESRRLRKQYREREETDRKERLLNEIIEWAEDVARLNFKIYNFIEAQIVKEPWVERGIGEIVSQFQVVEAKGVYINSIALSSFKEDKKLSKAIKAVNKEIRELVDVSVKRLDGEVTKEAVPEHMNILRLKITELFKETAKIKTRDIS